MAPLTHSVNVAGLAVGPAQVGVYPHPLLKIGLAVAAVEMLWVPGLVQGTDTILQLCCGCSGYRALCSYLHSEWSHCTRHILGQTSSCSLGHRTEPHLSGTPVQSWAIETCGTKTTNLCVSQPHPTVRTQEVGLMPVLVPSLQNNTCILLQQSKYKYWACQTQHTR